MRGCETHLDVLGESLKDSRVRRVIEPILMGRAGGEERWTGDDVEYVKSLGLVTGPPGGVMRIANPIYQEVIPRKLTSVMQGLLENETVIEPYYHNGRMLFSKMIEGFQQYYLENASALKTFREAGDEEVPIDLHYQHAWPLLLLQAWLQRIANGGGLVSREYALGTERVDLFVRNYYNDPSGERKEERFLVEVKIVHAHESRDAVVKKGLGQLESYASMSNPYELHMLVVDARPNPPEPRIYCEQAMVGNWPVTVWGLCSRIGE